MASSAQQLVSRYGEAGQGVRILYGGSVKPANAKELLAVDECRRRAGRRRKPEADEFLAIAGVYR